MEKELEAERKVNEKNMKKCLNHSVVFAIS